MHEPGRNVLRRSVMVASFALGVAACSTLVAADGEVADPDNPAAIDIEAIGGIAALRQHTHVDSASGQFTYTMARLCEPAPSCPVLNSETGTIKREDIDALFRRVMLPDFRQLRKDYGTTKNGADMMAVVVTIHANGLSRSVTADDGTMPTILAQFVHDVAGAVHGQ